MNGSLEERINYAILKLNLNRHDIRTAHDSAHIVTEIGLLRYIEKLLLEIKETI